MNRTFTIFIILIANQLLAIAAKQEITNYLQPSFSLNDQIWSLDENPADGCIFLATSNGIKIYNGFNFKSLSDKYQQHTRSVAFGADSVLYTGGFEDFGYWTKKSANKYQYISLADKTTINPNDEIWKIYYNDSCTFFQSFTAIYEYNGHEIIKHHAPGFMLFMFKVQNRLVVQVLDQGLYYFDAGNFTFIDGSQQFINVKIHALFANSHNQWIIGTEKDGIYRFESGKFSRWNSEASDFLIINNCNAGLSLWNGNYAFGSILNGIIISNAQGEITEHYNYSNGLNNNTVLNLKTTENGALWIGLDEGMDCLNQSSNIKYFSTSSGSLGSIYALLIDKNKLYLGSNHGLFKADIHKKSDNFYFSNLQLIPNSQGQVWTTKQIDNQIFCGHNDGTFLVNQQFKKISPRNGAWVIKPYKNIILEGSYTGLIKFVKDNQQNWKYQRVEGYYQPTRHIEVDYLGYIWISHPQKGIYKLKPNQTMDTILQIEPFTHLQTDRGIKDVSKLNNRIIFLSGQKLFTYNYVNDSVVAFNKLNQKLANYSRATQIVPYNDNKYWFVDKNKLALIQISIDFEPTILKEYRIDDERVPEQDLVILPLADDFIISNRNGFAILKNREIKTQTIHHLNFAKLMFFGKRASFNFASTAKGIEVPYHANNIIFEFTNPDNIFTQATYEFRIPQIDKNWIKANTNVVRYYHLKYGSYVLELRANGGEIAIKRAFTIRPPWYLSLWAYGFYFLFLLASAYLVYVIIKQKLKKERKLLEFEVKQANLENQLENTNLELMLTLRFLIQKNESLQNIRNEVDTLKRSPGSTSIKFLRRLDKQINDGLDLQTKEWKMALHNLKLSQEGYFKKLKQHYPNLTNNDIRLCSYLRMNFNSKEIAKLLNVSTRAVEISRYRLRKKLKLESKVNLTDFLMNKTFEK